MKRSPRTLVLPDPTYDDQLARTLGHVMAGMADVGEAVATARSIGRPTPDRWHDAWSDRARRVREVARRAPVGPDALSAWLRVSEYERQAYFFLRHDLDDPRVLAAHARHVSAFRTATTHLDARVEELDLTVDGTRLTAYFFAPPGAGARRPVLLLPCGYDSTAEEGFGLVPAALARGYAAVTFEGPGQGAALIRDHLTIRPEFERVVGPLVDLLLDREDVGDLVLVGRSFAGFLAARAAAYVPRIAALVLDPAQPTMASRVPRGVAGAVAPLVVRRRIRRDPDSREFFGARMAVHGATSVRGYFAELRTRWDMRDVAGRIACPTLLVECEGDPVGGGGPELARLLTAPHTLLRFDAESGAGGHCGGLGQQVWVDAVLPWIAGALAGDGLSDRDDAASPAVARAAAR